LYCKVLIDTGPVLLPGNSHTHDWLSSLVSLCAFFQMIKSNLVMCYNLSDVNTVNRNTEVSTLDSLLIESVN